MQTRHIETAVNNDDAARREAQQPIAFSDRLERMELVEAYTQKPDGRRVPVEPGAVRTQLAPGVPNAPAYSSRKQMVAVNPTRRAATCSWRPGAAPSCSPCFQGSSRRFLVALIAAKGIEAGPC